MSRDATVSRSVLSDQVKDRLLQAILDGRYTPGSRIVETRAAREFGTSQAPVREALRDLEALGVVEISPFRGARVRRPSTDELLEAFVVRSELEALGARLALPHLTAEDLDQLAGCIDEMRQAAIDGDSHAEATADARFHGRLVELAGNGALGRVWRRLEPYSRTYITVMAPGVDRRRIAELHVPVLDALRSQDEGEAVAALRRHFADASAMLGLVWGQAGPDAPDRAPIDRPEPAQPPALRASAAPGGGDTTTATIVGTRRRRH